MLWGRSRPWFPHASITDLSEYIDARGEVGDQWYDAIRERESGKIARSKTRAACNRGTHSSAVAIEGGFVHCPACENSWPIGAAAWRAPKKEREGMS